MEAARLATSGVVLPALSNSGQLPVATDRGDIPILGAEDNSSLWSQTLGLVAIFPEQFGLVLSRTRHRAIIIVTCGYS